MRKRTNFFTALLFACFALLPSARAHAQTQLQPQSSETGKSKGIHTYTLVISGLHSADDAAKLNADLSKISGVLESKTAYESGTIVIRAKKGVMPEHLKKVIVAHNCDITTFDEKYE